MPRAPGLLEVLAEKAESFGGRVEELGPLRVVAAFGLEPVEDAPRRAAHAAIAIRKVARARPVDHRGARRPAIAIHASPGLVGQRRRRRSSTSTVTAEAYAALEGWSRPPSGTRSW